MRLNIVLVIAVALVACRGSEPTAPLTPERTSVTLTVLTDGLTPFAAAQVGFPSAVGAAGDKLPATLGGSAIRLALTDSVTGAFLVPDLPVGSHPLVVDFGTSFRGAATVMIGAKPVIVDARGVVGTSVTTITQRVDSLIAAIESLPQDSTGVGSTQIGYLRDKSTQLKSAMAQATDDELRQVALWIRANPGILAAIAPASSSSVAGPAPASSLDLSNAVDRFILRYTTAKIRLGGTIAGCAAGLAASGPLAIFAGVVCGTLIATNVTELWDLATNGITQFLVIPQEFFVTEAGSTLQVPSGVTRAPAERVTVDPGVTRLVLYTANLRSVTSADRGLVGALFAAADEAARTLGGVLKYLPDFVAPSFYPPATSRSGIVPVAATDVSVSLPGCNVTPSSNGAAITCNQVSATDLQLNAGFTYRNAYGTATAALPVTVNRTWASASPIWYTTNGTFTNAQYEGKAAVGCRFTITIPIQGNTPIVFTGWSGAWSNGHQEGGSTNVTVDPRQYDGIVWVRDNPFYLAHGDEPAPGSFTVSYSVSYAIPAIGQTGITQGVLTCAP